VIVRPRRRRLHPGGRQSKILAVSLPKGVRKLAKKGVIAARAETLTRDASGNTAARLEVGEAAPPAALEGPARTSGRPARRRRAFAFLGSDHLGDRGLDDVHDPGPQVLLELRLALPVDDGMSLTSNGNSVPSRAVATTRFARPSA
jgi:hypothetical protein